MIYNDNDLSKLLIVEEISRSILPQVFNASMIIPGRDGQRFMYSNFGIGYIRVKVRLIKDTREEVQKTMREIASLLFSSEPKSLHLRDEDLYNKAILSGMSDVEKYYYTGFVELEFECHDPFAYGISVTQPLNIAFDNKSTYECAGLIELVTQEINELSVYVNPFKRLKLIYPFKNGNVVVIDLKKESVTINGNLAMKYVSLDSDFFKIPPGKNLTVSAVGCSGTITFDERYL